ncbi:hypothetical protein [Patulibacter sp. SYSU D01012]|uniref:hypothetical protein n=1 Tax=Patulibacter sp. SYSU D01012 TaxID=2817381 RepID=UPI001B30ED0E|nr:hypothetical protein [Patulibacter sp. SYSU D01012]
MDAGRDTLPAVEPDRDLDDWGRSARLAALLDRTVWDAAHKVWFRVELEGAARIPATGGALLVVNGGGALSPVAPMLAKAVREEHPRRRESRLAVDPALLAQPGLSVALARAGAVRAHEDDLARLLGDEGALVVHAVRTDRLHDDAAAADLGVHPALRAAARTGVPVVPVAAVGADDAQPVLARLPLPGGRRLPVTLAFPHLGPLALLAYLPARLRLRTLAPRTDHGPGDAERLALSVARRLRHEHADMTRERRSRWT